MDPYLEGPTWMNFHSQLCAEIARQLIPRLRPRYVALLNERFVTEIPEELAITTASLSPDVGVIEHAPWASGATGPGTLTAPLHLTTVVPESILHFSVEIRDRSERRLVTSIEVLSPTNKHGDGYEEYRIKRNRVLISAAHLLEIDLLRQGRRVPMREPLPKAPYFVFLSRSENRPVADVWPIEFAQALPVVPVPLLPGDSDAQLDLQIALSNVYDLCAYDILLDYSRSPQHPIPRKAAAWVEKCLRAAGLRKRRQAE